MSISSLILQLININKKFFEALKKIFEKWDTLKLVNLCTNFMKNPQIYFLGFEINFFNYVTVLEMIL